MGKHACWLPGAGEDDWVHSGSHLPIVVRSVHLALCNFGVTAVAGQWPETPVVTAASLSQGNIKTGETHVEKGQNLGIALVHEAEATTAPQVDPALLRVCCSMVWVGAPLHFCLWDETVPLPMAVELPGLLCCGWLLSNIHVGHRRMFWLQRDGQERRPL